MKQLILAAVAVLMLTSISSAQMGRRANGGYRASREGVFSRMIELERRKNAWLRGRLFRR